MNWIKVKEKKPKLGVVVYVRTHFGDVDAKLIRRGRGFTWDSPWFISHLSGNFVTHWAEIEAPKEES